jgi:hypothetical protein
MNKYAEALQKGYEYIVIVQYDCGLGDQGTVISRHRTYDAARKAANRTGYDSFLSIRDHMLKM